MLSRIPSRLFRGVGAEAPCYFVADTRANDGRTDASYRLALEARPRRAAFAASPTNSYYSKDRLHALVGWLHAHFEHCCYFEPPGEYSLNSLGRGDSAKKQRHVRYRKRANRKAVESAGLATRVVSDWAAIDREDAFRESLDEVRAVFRGSRAFSRAVDDQCRTFYFGENARRAIRGLAPLGIAERESVAWSREYLLRELAFSSRCDEILDSVLGWGRGPVALIYHERWPLLERFVSGEFGERGRFNAVFYAVKMTPLADWDGQDAGPFWRE